MKYLLLIIFCVFTSSTLFAQNDSLSRPSKILTKADSVYLAKLNSSGNLMIAGGIGLMGASGYLIYQGYKIYTDKGTPPNTATTQRNQRQGTIYLAAGGAAVVAGIVLTAFGATNKVAFKQRKKLMTLQSGLLDSGGLGLAFGF